MPADVIVKEISAGGLAEKVDDWTKQAATNVNTGVRHYVEQKGTLQTVPMPTLSAEEQARLDQHIAPLGTIAGKPYLVQLSDIHARLICPSKEIPAKQGRLISL